mmetsp:Transcript_81054/g.206020  ORF Transcript_81054/g.206020 Transcript_81054/m.206020 type:complete len:234 (-) Transcript_81054:2102-2803(-)
MNWVGREPTAWHAARQSRERLILCDVFLRLLLAEHGDDVSEHGEVGHSVDKPTQGANPDQRRTRHTVHAGLAIRLHDQACGNDADDRGEYRLRGKLDVIACESACRDRSQNFEMVERVDIHVGGCHRQEEPPSVATWEVENQDAQDGVQEQVRIAAHFHRAHCHPLCGVIALDLRVRADDEPAQQKRGDDRREGLDQEGDQECGREGIAVSVLGERPLHAIRLKLRGEFRDLL